MASPLISQAVLNHSIAFVPENRAALLLNRFSALPKFMGVTAASRLEVRCGQERKRHDQEGHDFSRTNKTSLKTGALAPKRKMEGPVEQALRVTDLLLQSGGFGMVAIDLSDIPLKMARRIPLTSWFRFQRAVENTPTVLFVIGQVPCAQTCATLLLKLQASEKSVVGPWSSVLGERPTTNDVRRIIPPHAQLLDGLQVE